MRPVRSYSIGDDLGGSYIRRRYLYDSKEEEAKELEECFESIERLLKENEQTVYKWIGYYMIQTDENESIYRQAAFVYTARRFIFSYRIYGSLRLEIFDMSEFTDCVCYDGEGFVLPEVAVDFLSKSVYFLCDFNGTDRTAWNLCKELKLRACGK